MIQLWVSYMGGESILHPNPTHGLMYPIWAHQKNYLLRGEVTMVNILSIY